jgi:6,7-dimethyl-8-ribityllumazine synthase
MLGASPKIEVKDLAGKRIGIVSSQWHLEICEALVAGAKRAVIAAGINEVTVRTVAGSFEIPLAAQEMLDDGCDAVVTVGLVLRGETPHFDYVCQGVTSGVMNVMLSRGKPIGFGVLMCDNLEQAHARSGLPGSKEDKGYDAAIAALDMLRK